MATIRKIVKLTDPEYFCNKSWTVSYSFITESWLSFHSYIPNWYIGENNFFYSGKASCCDLFDFMAGELVSNPVTTTSTTTFPLPPTTTSTTTLAFDCSLIGTTHETDCALDGIGTITIPPPAPPCTRPGDVHIFSLFGGYATISPPLVVDSKGSYAASCAAKAFIYENSTNVEVLELIAWSNALTVGNNVFLDNDTQDCSPFPDGFYYTLDLSDNIYEIKNGVVKSVTPCIVTTTTTTTICDMYLYRFEAYSCINCSPTDDGTLGNTEPLTVGKFYYDSSSNEKIKIVEALGCDVGTDRNILNSTAEDSCPAVACP